jgi:hypothetical protein
VVPRRLSNLEEEEREAAAAARLSQATGVGRFEGFSDTPAGTNQGSGTDGTPGTSGPWPKITLVGPSGSSGLSGLGDMEQWRWPLFNSKQLPHGGQQGGGEGGPGDGSNTRLPFPISQGNRIEPRNMMSMGLATSSAGVVSAGTAGTGGTSGGGLTSLRHFLFTPEDGLHGVGAKSSASAARWGLTNSGATGVASLYPSSAGGPPGVPAHGLMPAPSPSAGARYGFNGLQFAQPQSVVPGAGVGVGPPGSAFTAAGRASAGGAVGGPGGSPRKQGEGEGQAGVQHTTPPAGSSHPPQQQQQLQAGAAGTSLQGAGAYAGPPSKGLADALAKLASMDYDSLIAMKAKGPVGASMPHGPSTSQSRVLSGPFPAPAKPHSVSAPHGPAPHAQVRC